MLIRRSRERRVPKMIRFAYGDTRVSLRNPSVQYAHPSLLGKSHPPVLHICINLPRSLRIESPVDAVRRYYTYPYTNYRFHIRGKVATSLHIRLFSLSYRSSRTELSSFSFIERNVYACSCVLYVEIVDMERRRIRVETGCFL